MPGHFVKILTGLLYDSGNATDEMQKISLKGDSILYRLFSSVYCRYPVSNETYNKAIGIIESLKGIDRYIGICGGGTQNLYLLGKLNEKNHIKDVHLVDESATQLGNFSELVKIYNRTRNDKEYRDALEQHAGRYHIWLLNSECLKNSIYRKSRIGRGNLTIELEHDEIGKYLGNVREKGRYFVYLSNALFSGMWLNFHDSYKVLEKMISNENFEDGSVVFISDLAENDALVFEKRWNRLLPPGGRAPSTKYLANILNKWHPEGM